MLKSSFTIGEKMVGEGRTFIIAEIGSNHNQDMNIAKKLIDVAVESDADAVKFQSLNYDELYTYEAKNRELDHLFEGIELKEQWHEELSDYCNKRRILFFSAATYLRAVDILERLSVKLHKIASPQTATFPQLIERVAKTKRPIVMSTGYCTLEEIDRAVKIVEEAGNEKLALLHCISEYPAKPRDVNLEFIQTLKQAYNIPVGFSDHTLGWKVTLAAVAKGADIIEKHITLSRDSDGPDHYFAVEPPELEEMIKDIRTVEESFGTGRKLRITRDEANSLSKIRMRAVAKRDFSAGEIIDKEKDVAFRRTRTGIDAWEIYRADKLILGKNIKKGEALTYEYLEIERKSD